VARRAERAVDTGGAVRRAPRRHGARADRLAGGLRAGRRAAIRIVRADVARLNAVGTFERAPAARAEAPAAIALHGARVPRRRAADARGWRARSGDAIAAAAVAVDGARVAVLRARGRCALAADAAQAAALGRGLAGRALVGARAEARRALVRDGVADL